MLLAATVALSSHEPQAATLRGAWRIVRTSLAAGEQPNFRDYTQAGLLLFTARHYSLMYVEGNEPRKPFADPMRPTEAERLDAFNTFAGHTGTYALEDSIVAMQIVVAKMPNMAGPELRSAFARFAFQITRDTLRLTRRTPQGAFTMQLVRAE